MRVRCGSQLSQSFGVSNGVRQCCFSPSAAGLQDLLDARDSFSYKNGIVLNSNKSQCMQFLPKSFYFTNVPVVRLCNETLNFSKKVKRLDVRGVFEKYRDCMLCTNNTCNSDKSFVF